MPLSFGPPLLRNRVFCIDIYTYYRVRSDTIINLAKLHILDLTTLGSLNFGVAFRRPCVLFTITFSNAGL